MGELRARHEAELGEVLIAAVREGATAEQIAQALGVSRSTVWRRHGQQLRQGKRRRR